MGVVGTGKVRVGVNGGTGASGNGKGFVNGGFAAAARAACRHWFNVAEELVEAMDETRSLTLFTALAAALSVNGVAFCVCESISVAGESDALDVDEDDEAVDFCCP